MCLLNISLEKDNVYLLTSGGNLQLEQTGRINCVTPRKLARQAVGRFICCYFSINVVTYMF